MLGCGVQIDNMKPSTQSFAVSMHQFAEGGLAAASWPDDHQRHSHHRRVGCAARGAGDGGIQRAQ
eukprot:3364623-Pleurochrysis_carterae.AAC.1